MSIRPHTHKKGWWIIDYYPLGRKGKRVRFPFEGSQGQALALEQELRRRNSEVKNTVSVLIKDLVPEWLQYYQNEVRPRTYDDAVDCLAHLLPAFGNFRPANISRSAINSYKASRLQCIVNPKAVARKVVAKREPPKYTSKRTINKELSYLSSLLRWAADEEHFAGLPFRINGFPRKQTVAKKVQPLTPRQVSATFNALEPEYELLFLMMSDMGLRRSEALYIKAEDVDEYRETLNVTGKGDKQRVIPWLSDRFTKHLLTILDQRPSGYLCVNPNTGEPFKDTKRWLIRAAKKAEIKRHIHPHLLRHSCLSNLAMKGMSPHALQQIAGHSNIETTNKIYVHIRHDFVKDEAEKIRKMI